MQKQGHYNGGRLKLEHRDQGKNGTYFLSLACCVLGILGSGPINLIEMAFIMTRNTRKSMNSGVRPR